MSDCNNDGCDDPEYPICDKSSGTCGQAGGKPHKKHNGRTYVVRTGSRGGKYILVKGKKIYL